jgi:hypothetical protein
MMPSGQLGVLAKMQLAAWETLAEGWATFQVLDVDTGIYVERCASCFTSLWRHNDSTGAEYVYTDEQQRALVVAHLRLSHPDLDPDV